MGTFTESLKLMRKTSNILRKEIKILEPGIMDYS
jgi:hypothetical protein